MDLYSAYRVIYLLLICSSILSSVSSTTFLWNQEAASWQVSVQGNAPVCLDIPANLSLCQGIGYSKMRLPNLLHHDSLQEVSQQATSWVPLFQLGCNPDTKLFLCSLFTPVCLDHPIPPCRSLCISVQSSCEKIMSKYGYPWPNIVRCDQFPVDNDMCIKGQHTEKQHHHQTNKEHKENSKELEPQNHHFHSLRPALTDKQKLHRQKKKQNRKQQHKNHQTFLNNEPKLHLQSLPLPSMSQQSQDQHEIQRKPPLIFNQADLQGPGPVLEGSKITPIKKEAANNEDPKKIYNEVLTRFCEAEWALKARGEQLETPDQIEIKLRNYQVLYGHFPLNKKQIHINVPISEMELLKSHEANQSNRRRFFILGKTSRKQHVAVYAIPWPHKVGQFRKALKAIKSGNTTCSNHKHDSHDLVPSKEVQVSKLIPVSSSDQVKEKRQQLKKERQQRKQAKAERKRQKQEKKEQEGLKTDSDVV